MELIINISEEIYNTIMCTPDSPTLGWMAIAHGTVLPKGHGDLIDRQKFDKLLRKYGLDYEADTFLPMAETVIPTDKEGGNGAEID